MACDSSDGDRKKKKIERGVAASEAKQQPQSVKPSLPWPYAFPDDTGFSFMTYFFHVNWATSFAMLRIMLPKFLL